MDNAFKERAGHGPVYLLFSVNGSGHFCGIAEMISQVDYGTDSGVWAQDKWKGQFKVRWIYVKDVPNGELRHIRLENNENKPVTNSRDTQEVPPEKGRQVVQIIHKFKHSTSIFDDFEHYEKRQVEDSERKVLWWAEGIFWCPMRWKFPYFKRSRVKFKAWIQNSQLEIRKFFEFFSFFCFQFNSLCLIFVVYCWRFQQNFFIYLIK